MLILTKIWSEYDEAYNLRNFKIFNYENHEDGKSSIIYESNIYNKSLIGRLESGSYSLMDGMIYFSNDCIKLRYDVINRKDAHIYLENEIFDYYFNIFDLEKGESVKQGTPLDSYRDHKLAYIVMNKEKYGISKIKFVPYLHEKRIYINR